MQLLFVVLRRAMVVASMAVLWLAVASLFRHELGAEARPWVPAAAMVTGLKSQARAVPGTEASTRRAGPDGPQVREKVPKTA